MYIKCGFKKLFSVLAMAVILGSCLFAAAETDVVFTERAEVEKESVIYSIGVTESSNICGLTLYVMYDEAQLEFVGYDTGKMLEGGMAQCNTGIGGKVILSYISTSPLTSAGEFLKIEFKIVSDEAAELNISAVVDECVDSKVDDIGCSVTSAEILNPLYRAQVSDGGGSASVGSSQTQSTVSSEKAESNVSSGQNGKQNNDTVQEPNEGSDVVSDTSDTVSDGNVSEGATDKKTDTDGEKEAPIGKVTVIAIVVITICAATAATVFYKKFYRGNKNEKGC